MAEDKDYIKKSQHIPCFKCKRYGHYASHCPEKLTTGQPNGSSSIFDQANWPILKPQLEKLLGRAIEDQDMQTEIENLSNENKIKLDIENMKNQISQEKPVLNVVTVSNCSLTSLGHALSEDQISNAIMNTANQLATIL